MAKSKFDKLLEAVEDAEKIKGEAVAGDEPGQFSQESFDKFVAAIQVAAASAGVKDNEPAVYDEALTVLIEAVKEFKESVNKDTESKAKEQEQLKEKIPETKIPETKTPNIELKGVVLKGWEGGRKGNHSIHLKNRIVSFTDGKADVTPELAEELRKAGRIE